MRAGKLLGVGEQPSPLIKDGEVLFRNPTAQGSEAVGEVEECVVQGGGWRVPGATACECALVTAVAPATYKNVVR